MIYPRRECPVCGTKFTPDHEQELTCGECHIWERDSLEFGSTRVTGKLGFPPGDEDEVDS